MSDHDSDVEMGDTPSKLKRISRAPCCLRCASYLGKADDAECDGAWDGAANSKRCTRCKKVRHDCDPMEDPRLIELYEAASVAIEAQVDRDELSDSSQAKRAADRIADRAKTRNKAFHEALRQYHNNKGKFVGDARTPRSARKGAAPATLNPFAGGAGSALAHQETNRLLGGLVEFGREVLKQQQLNYHNIDKVLAGEQPDRTPPDSPESGE